mmetsp:Transcript_17497/g.30032  ORF Transcript_17497/g.30032 Transcript_17497/m.30032 type:complete len:83 (-) Transcript_17497:255-503(-)
MVRALSARMGNMNIQGGGCLLLRLSHLQVHQPDLLDCCLLLRLSHLQVHQPETGSAACEVTEHLTMQCVAELNDSARLVSRM